MAKTVKQRATVICRMEDKILFVRKAKSKWTLPGGKIEAGEGPSQAAARELAEETGLEVENLDYIATMAFCETFHHVFEAPVRPRQKARARNEIADCRWFSPRQMARRNLSRQIKRLLKSVQQAAA
jgi:8-oxo-dGTP diphosphatase